MLWYCCGLWQIYAGCCPLHNVYFNDIQINRWRNFKDKGHLFTLNLPMTDTKIRRISLLGTFFLFLWINLFCSIADVSWNFDTVLQKNVLCFLSDFSRNFFQKLWFCSYTRIQSFLKNLISSCITLLYKAVLFNLD